MARSSPPDDSSRTPQSEDDAQQGRLQRQVARLQALNESLERRVSEQTRARRRANRDLRAAQAQVVESGKLASTGMLAASVAHELNNPLASMSSAADTLARAIERLTELLEADGALQRVEQLPNVLSAVADSGAVIGEATARVDEISHKLRAFTHLDAAKIEKTDINAAVRDAIVLLGSELDGVQIGLDLAKLPEIPVYPGAFELLFQNLIRNARRALSPGGTIWIRSALEQGHAVFEVRDNGCGIEPARLATLFEPSFTTRDKRVAAALGLSICQRIMQQHQGTIDVESTPGKGSTFSVRLPVDLDQRLTRI